MIKSEYKLTQLVIADNVQLFSTLGARSWEEVDTRRHDTELNIMVDKFLRMEKNGSVKGFVFERGETLIGGAIFHVDYSQHTGTRSMSTDFIYTLPQYRGTRAGLKFLSAFDEWARDNDIDHIHFYLRHENDQPRWMKHAGYSPSDIVYLKKILKED